MFRSFLFAGLLALSCASMSAAQDSPLFVGLEVQPEGLRLTDGAWEGEPYLEGGSSRPRVVLVEDFELRDGDARVVLLAEDTGGSGTRDYLAWVEPGAPIAPTVLLGDRVRVRGGKVKDRVVSIELIVAGEKDAACCPADVVRRTWTLDESGWGEATGEARGRLSVATIGRKVWRLRAFDDDETLDDRFPITLSVKGRQFKGGSGCNRYFAEFIEGKEAGTLRLRDVGATLMGCEPEAMERESRFHRLLKSVHRLDFRVNRLALHYEDAEEGSGALIFEELD